MRAASRICLESLDTDYYLRLEQQRGEEQGVLEKSGGSKGKSRAVAPNEKTPDWLASNNGEMYREEHWRRKPQMASCKFVARFALCIRTTGAHHLLTSVFSHFLSLLYRNFFHFYFCPDWNISLGTPDNFYRVAIRWEENVVEEYDIIQEDISLISALKIIFSIKKRLYLRNFFFYVKYYPIYPDRDYWIIIINRLYIYIYTSYKFLFNE